MKTLSDRCWEYQWRRCYPSRRVWKRCVRAQRDAALWLWELYQDISALMKEAKK